MYERPTWMLDAMGLRDGVMMPTCGLATDMMQGYTGGN
jgi:hypothetical protein